jgi:molecular chaperone DnaJ
MFWKSGWTWGNPFGWGFSGWVDVDLWDIFESFFGWGFSGNSRWQANRETPWEDLEYNIEVDLKTSIYWWKQNIKFNKKETCVSCSWEWWEWKKTCSKCNWRWQITYQTQSMFGTIQQTWACDECSWSWEQFEKICDKCNWEKRKVVKKELEVEIPAGIDSWMVIKITWEWNDWIKTNTKWDLYVKFHVKGEEKWLKRDWVNLFYNLEVDVIEAILWTTKEINIGVIWKRSIEIKAWTNHWETLKIKSDWVKHIDSDNKWDLYIEISLKIPKKLGKKERELYEEIAKEKKINVNKSWVFKKIFG